MANWLSSFLWILLFSLPGQTSDKFRPTLLDLKNAKNLIGKIPSKTKLIILSDAQHRLPNTRAATLLVAQALAEKYPREKICLFFETTEKVDSYWEKFKKSDGSEAAYSNEFEPIARKLSSGVDGLAPEKAGRIFVEPPFFMAAYLKEKVPSISIFGVDVDYSDKVAFGTLYNNAAPPRKLNDNEFAKTFIADRNLSMAKKSTENLKTKCQRAILSVGNMHVQQWSGDKKTFPNYTGNPIPGIVDLIDKKVTNEPVIFDLFVTSDRKCPDGEAQIKTEECGIEFSRLTPHYFEVELPKDFFKGHVHKADTKIDLLEATK